MSYAERLNGFNQAISSTNDHVKALRDAMNNPEIRENPIKMGLETAGQVTGTIGGVVGGVARVKDSAVMRNVQKAFFDKLTQAKKAGAPQSVIDGITDKVNKAMGNAPTGDRIPSAPESNGAHNADNGNSGGSELGPGGTESGLGPGGTESGAGSSLAPTAPETGDLGGDLPFSVGAGNDLRGAGTEDVTSDDMMGVAKDFQARIASGDIPTAEESSDLAEGSRGIFDTLLGKPGSGLLPSAPGASATATADISTGGASAGAGANSNSVARSTVPEDNLQANLPFEAGGSAPATGNPSSDAHAVSQQQGSNASTHSNASDPSQQATSDLDPEAQIQASRSSTQGDANANDAGNIDSSATLGNDGANVADDVGKGLKTATKVEEGLDELAPDTGPLAPFLEVGSLLATLGTSIAGLFEKKDKTTAPPPPKPGGASMALAVGANLKQGVSGSVGAF